MIAYEYRKKDLAGYPFNANIHQTMRRMADCIMVIKTIQKRRFTTTLLFRVTTCVSVTMVRSIISCLNRIMPHNATNISRMRYVGSRMAMLFLKNSRLTERD